MRRLVGRGREGQRVTSEVGRMGREGGVEDEGVGVAVGVAGRRDE